MDQAARPSTETVRRPSKEVDVIAVARTVLELEARAIQDTSKALDQNFVRAVRVLGNARSRVVVTGMGKSGIVAKKIAATLSSTGTPSIFIHAAEATHGDLGMIQGGDVLLALSNSGETEEVIELIPSLRLMGVKLIALVGDLRSTLSRVADVALQVCVTEEGCPLGLAPMSSTTAMLAFGDALAAALMKTRDFQREEYAVFHPSGSLGRKLLVKVSDLMHSGDALPLVRPEDSLRLVIQRMISTNLGLAIAVGSGGQLEGLITDGDIKRILDREGDFFALTMGQVMNRRPRTIDPTVLAETALRSMEENPERQITVMPVVDESDRVVGIVRMHDILQAKIR